MRILDDDFAHVPEYAAGDHLAGLPDHRVTQVSVRKAINALTVNDHRMQRLHLGQVQRRGFLAEHMKTGAQCLPGNRCVQMIGRNDDQQLHALLGGQGRLAGEQGLPIVVTALGGQTQRGRGALIVLGVAAERAADQFEASIEAGGLPVGAGDEGTFTASDKTHSYFFCGSVHGSRLGAILMSDVTGYIVGEI
ncbi:hypothetical protein QE391_002301 [Pseudomonas fluorescens]|nr:hypothetical protein [Pseudomonas fluorescens]